LEFTNPKIPRVGFSEKHSRFLHSILWHKNTCIQKKEDYTMLENKKHNGIHYSRYIASWRNIGGKYFEEEFIEWLKSEGFNEDDARDVREMAMCGKMELEMSAKKFVNKERSAEMIFEQHETAKRTLLGRIINKRRKK
jgi:hypothetical protein